MAISARSVIIILGMHRSGLSVLSGCLKILGAHLDSEMINDDPAHSALDNETNDIVSIHDILFRDLGFRWDMIGNLPEGWRDSKAAVNARESLERIFQRDFCRSGLWVVSDPRTCRLMPLWLNIFQEMKIDPCFIHMVRHPFEVAASIKTCGDFDLRKGQLLWMVYNRDALSACNGQRHTLITYDQLLADPLTTLNAVGEKLKITYPAGMENCCQQIIQFVRPEHKHHHHHQTSQPTVFIHFLKFYDRLRRLQVRPSQSVPDPDRPDGVGRDTDMDDGVMLPLLLAEQDVSFNLSDKVPAVELFNELLDLLSYYESIELNDNKQRLQLLLNADKNAEVLYAEVFFPGENTGETIYTEKHSHKELLLPDKWQQLCIELRQSGALQSHGLVLKPLNHAGMVQISGIRLKNAATSDILWELNSDSGFDSCDVKGTSLCLCRSDELKILSTGKNPRVILPAVSGLPDVPLTLEIWLRVSRDLTEVLRVWAEHDEQLLSLNNQIETLNARCEHLASERTDAVEDFEKLRIRHEWSTSEINRMDAQISESKRLADELEKRNREWEKKKGEVEKELDAQRKLTQQYFAVLAGVEKELAEVKNREKRFKLMLRRLERDFKDLRGSARWKLGNGLLRMGEVLLLRKKQPLAVDHMQKIFDQVRAEKNMESLLSPQISRVIYDTYTVKKLNSWMRQLNNDFHALKNSKRWKLGNAVIRLLEMLTFNTGHALATDHLEAVFKDYEKMSADHAMSDVKTLQSFLKQPEKDFHAIAHSGRWKVGNAFFSVIDLLLRRQKPTVFDHVNAIYQEYNAWQREK